MPVSPLPTRRSFLATSLTAGAAALLPAYAAPGKSGFTLRYLVASSLYGNLPLAEILPQVRATGAEAIELWSRPHGFQRDEADTLGAERLAAELRRHNVRFAGTSRFDLGPFGLADEFRYVSKLGGQFVLTNGRGRNDLVGPELRTAVRALAEQLKPTLDAAAAAGVDHFLENHSSTVITSPDSIRWLLEFTDGQRLKLALAPYHLPQDAELMAKLIRDIGPRLGLFYAWQHGRGAVAPLTKDEELLQLPGRGPLDFTPLLAALKSIQFSGWTEIFMHPIPRGIPIRPTAEEVTAELNRARAYLEARLRTLG